MYHFVQILLLNLPRYFWMKTLGIYLAKHFCTKPFTLASFQMGGLSQLKNLWKMKWATFVNNDGTPHKNKEHVMLQKAECLVNISSEKSNYQGMVVDVQGLAMSCQTQIFPLLSQQTAKMTSCSPPRTFLPMLLKTLKLTIHVIFIADVWH